MLSATAAFAQPEAAGEASLKLPDLSSVNFLGMDWPQDTADRHPLLLLRTAVRTGDLHAAQEPAGPPLDARDLRTHLRNLQDLPDYPRQVHSHPWAFIAVVIVAYFGWLAPVPGKPVGVTLPIILCFSLIGIAAATEWRGSVFASTPSPTRAPPSPDCAASRIPSMPFR